jgi:hypothetical protein
MDKFNSWLKSSEKNISELEKILKSLPRNVITRSLFFYLDKIYSRGSKADPDVINTLVQYGADVEYKDLLYNKKALALAFENGDALAINTIFENMDPDDRKDFFTTDIARRYLSSSLPSFKNLSSDEIRAILKNYKYKPTLFSSPNSKGETLIDEIMEIYPYDTREHAIIYHALFYDFNDRIVKNCIDKIAAELNYPVNKVKKVIYEFMNW